MTLGPGRRNRSRLTLALVLSSSRLLRRLWRYGVPGRAPAAGVPIDRRAETEAELAGIFAALQPVVDECSGIRDRAALEAADTRRRAENRARRIEEVASARAGTEAADEARRELERLTGEAERIVESARGEALRIGSASGPRVADLRDRIVAAILALPRAPAA